MDIEAVSTPGRGEVRVTGIVEEEEIGPEGHRLRRKSTAHGSAENVKTLLAELGFPLGERNLHINFPGGAPVDGPSAGVAMAVVAVSALTGQKVDGACAVTGEISVQGQVKPVGGVPAKLEAARQAGIRKVFIPKDNDMEGLHELGMEVRCVSELREVLEEILLPVTVQEAELPDAPATAGQLPLAAQGQG